MKYSTNSLWSHCGQMQFLQLGRINETRGKERERQSKKVTSVEYILIIRSIIFKAFTACSHMRIIHAMYFHTLFRFTIEAIALAFHAAVSFSLSLFLSSHAHTHTHAYIFAALGPPNDDYRAPQQRILRLPRASIAHSHTCIISTYYRVDQHE